MAFGHQRHIPGRCVVYRDKMRHQVTVFIDNGKVFLMFPHGGDQHFTRKFQKLVIKSAGNHRRKFDKIFYDVNECVIF